MWLAIYLIGLVPAALFTAIKVREFDVYPHSKVDDGSFALFVSLFWPISLTMYILVKSVYFISEKLSEFADQYISRRKQ